MTESVADFAQRARAWLADSMPRIADPFAADRGVPFNQVKHSGPA